MGDVHRHRRGLLTARADLAARAQAGLAAARLAERTLHDAGGALVELRLDIDALARRLAGLRRG